MSHSHVDGADNAARVVRLRQEAVEIVARRKRNLSGLRTSASPAPAAANEDRATRALLEGHRFLSGGQMAEALLRAEMVVALAPHTSTLAADGWTLFGQVRLKQGNPQAARSACANALLANPAHVGARLCTAECYCMMRQPERAVRLYLEALALIDGPHTRTKVRMRLAAAYRASGRPLAARRALHAAEGLRYLQPLDRFRTILAYARPADKVEQFLLIGNIIVSVLAAVYTTLGTGLLLLLFGVGFLLLLQWWKARS